ncbi:hypothetical protein A3839_24395 [Achromobacter insolitus]|nr:hypothetical protein A3839_24395 [Achromobacter insolitus]
MTFPLTLIAFPLSGRFGAGLRVTNVLLLGLALLPSSESSTVHNPALHRIKDRLNISLCHVQCARDIFRRDTHVTSRDIA